MRRRRSGHRAGLVLGAAALPIVAVLLGGATQPWTQGIVLAGLGLLVLLAPPRSQLGGALTGTFLILALLPGLAFLPARWFGEIGWRRLLTEELGLVISDRLTPQPWLTLDAWILWGAGLTWLYWLLTVRWTNIERARLARWLALGVVLVAALCLAFRATGYVPRIWEAERGFGPFPNRNQTGNFFALGALLLLARAHLDFRRRAKPWVGLGWIAGWLLVAGAVFQSNSRAGVLLLFGGAAVYLAGIAWLGARQAHHLESEGQADEEDEEESEPDEVDQEARQRREQMVRTLALGATLLLVGASAFFLVGGDTLQRFRSKADPLTGENPNDLRFRLLIQGDALDLGAASAWPGTGLGNMSALLTLYRNRAALPARGIHPESDWVWLRVELGWLGVAVVLIGTGLILRRIFPLRRGGVEPIRLAGLVALAGLALHGLVDVSGHRVGSAFSALAIIALAVPAAPVAGRFLRLPLLGLGGLFAALGVIWSLAVWERSDYPGTIGAQNHLALAYEAVPRGQPTLAVEHVTRALRWAPLDHYGYLVRAELGAALRLSTMAVEDDFARASGLERQSPIPPLREAQAWLKWQPVRSIKALAEACARSPRQEREFLHSLLGQMNSIRDDGFRQVLRGWMREDANRLLAFLQWGHPEEVKEEVRLVLEADPALRGFSRPQLVELFSAWSRHGDALALLRAFDQRPEWQTIAWESWATAAARAGESRRACEIALRFAPAPPLPEVASDESIPHLEREVVRQPDQVVRVYQLFQALLKAGRPGDAVQVIARVTAQTKVPAYMHYVEAGARAQHGDFERAWECWQRYFAALRPS
ncbi:MAG: hypothetical protein JSR82_15525 [Verrucomicrobia bacterium]|nr:hypothetical protein [Verrucomicrobiota bacterium]